MDRLFASAISSPWTYFPYSLHIPSIFPISDASIA